MPFVIGPIRVFTFRPCAISRAWRRLRKLLRVLLAVFTWVSKVIRIRIVFALLRLNSSNLLVE